jgi:Pyruvate/2-oxoacid:ferredoxin oxidoreductase gamma subunit
MKINGGISVGNIITMVMLAVTVAVAYGAMVSNLEQVEEQVSLKADKAVVDLNFEYIKRDLSEIKELVKNNNRRKK